MRGPTTAQDLLNDVNTALVIPRLSGVNFPSAARVMTGVFTPWASVHDQVIAEVRRLINLCPSYTLESTGHSLGGSLTYLSYIDLTQNFPTKSVTSNALATFPIGNSAFASFGQSQKGVLRWGNNALDGVPNMYVGAPQNFVHCGIVSPLSMFFKIMLVLGVGILQPRSYSHFSQCSGERDLQCSAGNGLMSVTVGHFSSFGGATLGAEGCGAGLPGTNP